MLETLVSARIDQHHWNALTCWLWSVQHGHAGHAYERWEDSTLLRFVEEEKFILAASEFEAWGVYRGKLSRWMGKLRTSERILFCTGEVP